MRGMDPLPENLRTGTLGTRPPAQPGRTSQVHVVLSDDEYKDQAFKMRLDEIQTLKRMARMAYDYSKPVDEYVTIPALDFTATSEPITVPTDYGQAELYTTLHYTLPLGCTSATLLIGTNRAIPLYAGAALATQMAEFQSGLTMLAGPDEKRQLILMGTLTTTGYLALMGHCYSQENRG